MRPFRKPQMQGAPDKQTHNALALMWSLIPEGCERLLAYSNVRKQAL